MIRPFRYPTLVGLALASVALAGCEKDKPLPSPPPAATAPTQPAAATRPTTQSLLTGPRKSLVLGGLPLQVDVPESWSVESPGGTIQRLVGPTPHGAVSIQLSSTGTAFTAATLGLMDEQMRKEAAASHGAVEAKPLRALGGGAKLREQLEEQPGTVIDADGHAIAAKVMDWSIEVYAPQDKGYVLNALHFDMLRADQYREDKEFLEKVVASVRYDATKGTLQ